MSALDEHDHAHQHVQGHDHAHTHNHETGDHSHSYSHSHEGASREDHGHTHTHMDHPGLFGDRDMPMTRDLQERAFTVGIGGPVGSGIMAIETGGCPHAAIREDISANLMACENLTAMHAADLILVESGGDNLAANYSRELADFIIYVIDVAGGDKVPRKGGPGITQSDLLVINKTDLAEAVGADLEVMRRESKVMRGDGETVFTQVKNGIGMGRIQDLILAAYEQAKNEVAKS